MDSFLLPDSLWFWPPFRLFCGATVGLVLGSFATMLSYRLPRGLSIVSPPSTCPRCKTRLGPADLVPLFSWLFSKGRCRHCGAPVSARYPLIELVTASAVTAAFFWLDEAPLALTLAVGLIVALVSGTTIWLETKEK